MLINPEDRWREPERWAWRAIKAGRDADFISRCGAFDPMELGGWDDRRKLGAEFLKELLFREPYRSAIPVEGVRIIGAWFPDSIDLSHGRLNHQLWLDDSRFEKPARFGWLRIEGTLSLEGSCFLGVGTSVDLSGARIGDHLNMDRTRVAGCVELNGLDVRQTLTVREGVWSGDAILTAARVGGQVAMEGTTVAGAVEMNRLDVGKSLFMREGAEFTSVGLTYAEIGGNLDLSGATLDAVDLSATRIEGELRLGSLGRPPTRWSDSALQVLHNTHVGALRDHRDGWPPRMEMDGFTYDRLSGFGGDAGGEMLARDIGWFIDWLERDQTYTPQPYEQLAKTFRAAGRPSEADRILYANRERARREAWRSSHRRRSLGLYVLNITIGYGIGLRYFRALAWVMLLGLFGSVVAQENTQLMVFGLTALAFSLDQLLPIVELERSFGEIKLTGLAQGYYWLHKLLGWVLASFLVAGLAGLTQK